MNHSITEIERIQDHHGTVLDRVKALRRYAPEVEIEMATAQTACDLGICESLVREALERAEVVA